MADTTTVARPYAKAAFSFAKEHKEIDAWSQWLKQLASFMQDSQMAAFIKNPQVTADNAVLLLSELSNSSLTASQQNFLHILADNHRLLYLAEIHALFETYLADYHKVMDVDVISVFPIGEILQNKLSAALEKRLQRKVSLHFQLDENLIGGAVIRAGDLVIDGSVRNKLNKLNDIMIN